MNWMTIGLSAGTLLGMAVILTYILGWANKTFQVEVDPRIAAVLDSLPGANCGGCGYIGCREYAEAVAAGKEPVNKCSVGGKGCAAALAEIMGIELAENYPYRPIVHCGAHYGDRLGRSDYRGEKTCLAANLVTDVQGCIYGCLGFGDCERACKYDAIHVVDGLATVDYEKCVGCGACAKACPRNIISMTPFKAEQMLAVTCSNKDVGREVMAVCKVGCIGCGACARISNLFRLEDNLPAIDYEDYSPACSLELMKVCEKCPRKGIVFVGKPAEKEIADTAHEQLPEVVKPDFKTTVDDTEWRG
ncbi:MAG TPA: RnfABCDGE type electron transport complex subunit B [Desulfobacterales bacterium]|nr:RnfABCDGE type electron transport complex subunit B [Desulfobacterales bacterium]